MITFFKILSFWLSIAFVIGGICIYRVKKRTGGKHGKRCFHTALHTEAGTLPAFSAFHPLLRGRRRYFRFFLRKI